MVLKVFMAPLRSAGLCAADVCLMGGAGLQGTDLIGYLNSAYHFANAAKLGSLHDFGWLEATPA